MTWKRMMAEDKPTAPETETADGAAPATPEDTGAPEAAEAKPPENTAETEAAEAKEKLLRTLAEMENLRRRTEREVADTRQYAVASFARDMLTVGDNLRRAIDSVPEASRNDGDPALKALIEGVEVTARGLEQTLAKFGVKPIDAKGQKFDPTFHQAMFEVEPSDNAPPGTVAQEMQAGYVIGERVLRPSMVGVAKKASKPAPANDDAPTDAEKAAATTDSGDTSS
jgi:molecular chaperone GrpE